MPETDRMKTLNQQKLEREINELRWWKPIKAISSFLLALAATITAILGVYKSLDFADQKIKIDEARLRVAATALERGFLTIFSEPSGITVTGILRPDGTPYLLAIDDEIEFPMLVEPLNNTLVPTTLLSRHDQITGTDDLEAVASVQDKTPDQWRYFAISSHRRYDEETECRVIRFMLIANPKDPARTIMNEVTRFSLKRGILDYFQNYDGLVNIVVDNEKKGRFLANDRPWWKREETKIQPYAIEIEAACAFKTWFYIGLKFPLDPEGRAIVLRYKLDDFLEATEDDDLQPVGHALVPLGEDFGITAMTVYQDTILVAANPTGKDKTRQFLNQSWLYTFDPVHNDEATEDVWEQIGKRASIKRLKAKAEGIAVYDDRLWIAYDGLEGSFDSIALDEVVGDN